MQPVNTVLFTLTNDVSPNAVLEHLGKRFGLQPEPRETLIHSYLDSHDWRVHDAGHVLDLTSIGNSHQLVWRELGNPTPKLRLSLRKPPRFIEDLPAGPLRDWLAPVLEMRALLPMIRQQVEEQTVDLKNEDGKTLVRLFLTCNGELAEKNSAAPLPGMLQVTGIRGYADDYQRVLELLQARFNLRPSQRDPLLQIAEFASRRPGDYQAKPAFDISPEMPAELAVKHILGQMLGVVRANEDGIVEDIDSEYLHDFRTAVRRSRSAVSQLKKVLAPDMKALFKEQLRWLQQITGPMRDLDVYLLGLPDYSAALANAEPCDLRPLGKLLRTKRRNEKRKLIKALRSEHYQRFTQQWAEYAADEQLAGGQPRSEQPIIDVGGHEIWKQFKMLMRDGSAIGPESPDEALHDLRKECKKLRYLIEFFQDFYEERTIKPLIKQLKTLQTNLGDFQDFSVQQETLRDYADQIAHHSDEVTDTVLALGRLIEQLHQKQIQTRAEFANIFASFSAPANAMLFEQLFKPKNPKAA